MLGAGTGFGSCAAPPFRSNHVEYPFGCPFEKPCCSEFGYCRERVEWDFGYFRDCNGVSNGIDLHQDTIAAEEAAGAVPSLPAGFLGPVIPLRESFEPVPVTTRARPTTQPPTKEELKKLNEPVVLKSKEEFLKLIFLINKHYGPEQAKQLEVKLKLKQKLPSSNFKTKKDFLAQLKQTLLKSPPKKFRVKTTPKTDKTTTTTKGPQSSKQPNSSLKQQSLKRPKKLETTKPATRGEQLFEEGMAEMKKKKLKELIKLENHMAELKKQKLKELIEIENHKLWVFSLQPGERRLIFRQK